MKYLTMSFLTIFITQIEEIYFESGQTFPFLYHLDIVSNVYLYIYIYIHAHAENRRNNAYHNYAESIIYGLHFKHQFAFWPRYPTQCTSDVLFKSRRIVSSYFARKRRFANSFENSSEKRHIHYQHPGYAQKKVRCLVVS